MESEKRRREEDRERVKIKEEAQCLQRLTEGYQRTGVLDNKYGEIYDLAQHSELPDEQNKKHLNRDGNYSAPWIFI